MKVSTLGKRTVAARAPYNKPAAENKNLQRGVVFRRKDKERQALIKKSKLDYKAKGMNPALANKIGKAVGYMITQGTKNLGLKRPYKNIV